jgi:ComF family protein
MLLDFISLVYPHNCLACGDLLISKELQICTLCRHKLPKTGFHLEKDNPVSKIFWGRVDIFSAASYLFFQKGGTVQSLLHHLKYKGNKEIGKELGKMYGSELKTSDLFNTADLILPVPLHPSKKRKRGYNQSEMICEGLSKGMDVECRSDLLVREVATDSQTRKSRFMRWKNVESIFSIKDEKVIAGKHILLVDDIITTGSTIESSAQNILQVEGTKVSVVSLAVTVGK